MNKLNQKVTNEKSLPDKNLKDVFLVKWILKIVRYPKLVLVVISLMTLFFISQIPKLTFDYDFNSFFPEGDPELAFYEEVNEAFGEYNNFLFLTITSDSILSPKTLSVIESFEERLHELSEIERIESPFGQRKYQTTPFGMNSIPLLTSKGLTWELAEQRGLLGSFLGRDQQSLMFIIHHQSFSNKETGDAFYLKLKEFATSHLPLPILISGKTQMQYDFTNKLEKEVAKLLILAFIVIVLILLAFFKSLKGLLFPLLVLLITVIWIMGFVALINKPLDIMAIVIPALLLIVALSDVIHFFNQYNLVLSQGLSSHLAVEKTIRSVGLATFLTSITTAIGFSSLYVLPIQPIRDFGLITALGVLLAFLISITVLPALLHFYPSNGRTNQVNNGIWKTYSNRIFLLVFKNPKKILIILSLVTAVFILGLKGLSVNTSILVGLQKNEPELKTVAYFDNSFDGYKPFEIGIQLNDEELMREDILTELELLTSYLSEIGVKQINSPLSIIKKINMSLFGGASSRYKVPQTKDIERVKRYYLSRKLDANRSFFESNGLIRIIGRLPDLGSAKTEPIYEEVTNYLKVFNRKTGLEAKLTGTSFLIDRTDRYVVSSIFKGLGLGIIIVSLFLVITFRSLSLLVKSLIPNLIPVIMIAGAMGWLGIDLNITTAIIFTITFGIAIDDTIHFLSKYHMEIGKRSHSLFSIKRTMSETGKSIVNTSVILMLGFAVFLSSGFSIPYYMGLMIILSTLIALVYDLTLLPILLAKKRR